MIYSRAYGFAVVFLLMPFALVAALPAAEAQSVPPNQEVLQPFRRGDYREAVTIAERAVAEAHANAGETHPTQIKALIELGHALMADKRFEKARGPMQRAVDLASASLPADAPLLADALDGLGTTHMLENYPSMFSREGPEAMPLLKRALAIREKRIPADPMAYVDLVERVSAVTADPLTGGDGRLLTRAIALARQDLGEQHLAVGLLLLTYADLTEKQAMLNRARTSAQDAEDGDLGHAESLRKSLESMTDPLGETAN